MIIDFLGHLHPVFVHLPIGFLALAYVIQYLFKSNTEKSRLIDFVLQHRCAEVSSHVTLVHGNVSFSGLHVQTRYCGLPSARCIDDFHSM